MKSWDNEDSIYVFDFLVCKVFVPVVTGKITAAFFGTPCIFNVLSTVPQQLLILKDNILKNVPGVPKIALYDV